MKLESLKSRLNNQKNRQFSEKITKSDTTFCENKANLKNMKTGLSSLETSEYETLPAWRGEKTNPIKPNLSQYKANTNPIYGMAKFALSSFMTSKYVESEDSAAKNQTQTNPIFILEFIPECCSPDSQQGNVSSLGFLSGDKAI